jgi:hypothetical protein
MTEELADSIGNTESLQPEVGRSHFQQQTLTLHNTVGLIFMSILAFALFIALLRQQKHYDDLIAQFSKQKLTPKP